MIGPSDPNIPHFSPEDIQKSEKDEKADKKGKSEKGKPSKGELHRTTSSSQTKSNIITKGPPSLNRQPEIPAIKSTITRSFSSSAISKIQKAKIEKESKEISEGEKPKKSLLQIFKSNRPDELKSPPEEVKLKEKSKTGDDSKKSEEVSFSTFLRNKLIDKKGKKKETIESAFNTIQEKIDGYKSQQRKREIQLAGEVLAEHSEFKGNPYDDNDRRFENVIMDEVPARVRFDAILNKKKEKDPQNQAIESNLKEANLEIDQLGKQVSQEIVQLYRKGPNSLETTREFIKTLPVQGDLAAAVVENLDREILVDLLKNYIGQDIKERAGIGPPLRQTGSFASLMYGAVLTKGTSQASQSLVQQDFFDKTKKYSQYNSEDFNKFFSLIEQNLSKGFDPTLLSLLQHISQSIDQEAAYKKADDDKLGRGLQYAANALIFRGIGPNLVKEGNTQLAEALKKQVQVEEDPNSVSTYLSSLGNIIKNSK
jgi:hypothetical protein